VVRSLIISPAVSYVIEFPRDAKPTCRRPYASIMPESVELRAVVTYDKPTLSKYNETSIVTLILSPEVKSGTDCKPIACNQASLNEGLYYSTVTRENHTNMFTE
jgi:hypothetical protein